MSHPNHFLAHLLILIKMSQIIKETIMSKKNLMLSLNRTACLSQPLHRYPTESHQMAWVCELKSCLEVWVGSCLTEHAMELAAACSIFKAWSRFFGKIFKPADLAIQPALPWKDVQLPSVTSYNSDNT